MHFHKRACYRIKDEAGHEADLEILERSLQCQPADYTSSSISE